MFRDISQVVYLLPFMFKSVVNNYVHCEVSSADLECWSPYASCTDTWESEGTAPLIHDLDTRLNGRSPSRLTRFNPGRKAPGTHLIEGPSEPQRRSGRFEEYNITDRGAQIQGARGPWRIRFVR